MLPNAGVKNKETINVQNLMPLSMSCMFEKHPTVNKDKEEEIVTLKNQSMPILKTSTGPINQESS